MATQITTTQDDQSSTQAQVTTAGPTGDTQQAQNQQHDQGGEDDLIDPFADFPVRSDDE